MEIEMLANDVFVFFKDQDDGSWFAAIVGFTERNPKELGIGEVLSFNVLPTKRAAQNWAAELIGPLGEPIYVAPELRH